MQIDRTWLFRILGTAFAALLLWVIVELSPGRQLDRSFSKLVSAAENRDWKKVKSLMADDYRDQWGLDGDQAIQFAAEGLRHFIILDIEVESLKVSRMGRDASVEARLRLQGRATAVGELIMQKVNSLENDFQFAWRQKSWKPWDWKLVSLSQNEIEIDPTWMP